MPAKGRPDNPCGHNWENCTDEYIPATTPDYYFRDCSACGMENRVYRVADERRGYEELSITCSERLADYEKIASRPGVTMGMLDSYTGGVSRTLRQKCRGSNSIQTQLELAKIREELGWIEK